MYEMYDKVYRDECVRELFSLKFVMYRKIKYLCWIYTRSIIAKMMIAGKNLQRSIFVVI